MLADAWRKIVARAKRRYGYSRIDYLAVIEAHKSGEPHLHIIARCRWIDQEWLSEQMQSIMASPVCDIRRIKSRAQAAGYVAKYCGKEPHRFGSTKRYWSTQSWEKWRTYHKVEPTTGQRSTWIVRHFLAAYVTQSVGMGFSVDYEGDAAWLTYEGFASGGAPPEPPCRGAADRQLNLI